VELFTEAFYTLQYADAPHGGSNDNDSSGPPSPAGQPSTGRVTPTPHHIATDGQRPSAVTSAVTSTVASTVGAIV
jgi:hypothetical protein